MSFVHDLPQVSAPTFLDRSDEIRDHGFCIMSGILPEETILRLGNALDPHFDRTPFAQGKFYGESTKRFGGLLSKSHIAQELVQHRQILSLARTFLGPWCDTIQLNLAQAIEIHPGAMSQAPHRDQDMWRGDIGEKEYLINVMWPLTPYTRDNGATLVWPDSHGANALEALPTSDPIVAECGPGDAFVFLGSTLHGAGANKSSAARRGVLISYSLGWLKPYEAQWLVYPPEVARSFDRSLSELIGYLQHRPNLGNFEGQCPSVLFKDDKPANLPAIDALRPDQVDLLTAYVEEQRRLA